MVEKKKDKGRKKYIAAAGIGGLGLGGAYLLSKNKKNIANAVKNNVTKTNPTKNLTLDNLTDKKTADTWSKIAEKINNLPSVRRSRNGQPRLTGTEPKGLLRAGFDRVNNPWDGQNPPRVNWQSVAERAQEQRLLPGRNPRGLLRPRYDTPNNPWSGADPDRVTWDTPVSPPRQQGRLRGQETRGLLRPGYDAPSNPWDGNNPGRVNWTPDQPRQQPQQRLPGRQNRGLLRPGYDTPASPWLGDVSGRVSVRPDPPAPRPQGQLPGRQPRGLLRSGYDTPSSPWTNDTVDRISVRPDAPQSRQQDLLPGSPTPRALPASRMRVDVAVKGYRRKDGTFVSGYQRRIEKALEDLRVEKAVNNIEADVTQRVRQGARPANIWGSLIRKNTSEPERVRQEIKQILQDRVDRRQDPNNYTLAKLVESGEVDSKAIREAGEQMRQKYRNADQRKMRVTQLVRESDDLAKELEEKAIERFSAKRQGFNTRFRELQQKIKKYEPDVYDRKLSTDRIETQLRELQNDFEKTLTDPFAPDYFSTSSKRIAELKKQLEQEIADVNGALDKPNQYLQLADQYLSEIETLRKEYRKTLEKVYDENKVRVDTLKSQLAQEYATLENLTESNVTNKFLREQKAEYLKLIGERKNRQFFGRRSNYERQLARLETSVTNTKNTIKIRGKKPQENLTTYLDELTQLRDSLDLLPKTRRNLTKAQRAILRETQSFPETYKKYYGELIGNIEELHAFEKDFAQRYASLTDEINQHTKNIFSNETLEDYFADLQKDIDRVEELYPLMKNNIAILDKIHDPNAFMENYVKMVKRVNDLNDTSMTTSIVPLGKGSRDADLIEAIRRKRVVMRGGYIDGKEYKGILSDLKISQHYSYVKNGLENASATAYLAQKSSVVKYDDERLAKLADEYVTRKKQLLEKLNKSKVKIEIEQKIDKDLWTNAPQAKQVKEKIENLVQKYNDDFGTTDMTSSFFNQKTLLEDAKQHIEQMGSYKPKFEIKDDQIRLVNIERTDIANEELNKNIVDRLKKEYGYAQSKTKNKRMTIATLYYELDKKGIKVEGDDNFFKRLRKNNLTPEEKTFYDSLEKNNQILLRNFANYGLDDKFQEYYYQAAFGFSLREGKSLKLFDDIAIEIGRKDPGLVGQMDRFIRGRISVSNIQRKKLIEVQSAIRDLRSLGTDDVRLSPFYTVNGEKIPYANGLMGVENLPPILPGSQHKYRNTLVRKIRTLMGVRDNGTPLYNVRLATILSGAEVKSREDLLKLLKDIETNYYGEVDLNTLYMAAQLNFERLKALDADLHVYNFSQKEVEKLARF